MTGPKLRSPLAAGFSSEHADPLAALLKAVASPERLLIIAELNKHESAVNELVDSLGYLSQPTVSHHLRILAGAGIVAGRKEGHYRIYTLDPEALKALGELVGGR